MSICLDSRRPWPDQLSIAHTAEEASLARLYVADHFMPYDPAGPVAGDVLECWTTLSALALATTRIGLGSLVLGNAYRHPAVVANMAATLDRISGGRLLLGLGAGWQSNEHTAYGIELPAVGMRLDRFEEAVQVISRLLTQEVSDFDGVHYRLDAARCEPAPLQHPLPLLVAGAGERRTIPLAARFADAWHAWAAPEVFRHKAAIVDDACRAVGRNPPDLARLTGQVLLVTRAGGSTDDDEDIIGSADVVLTRLGAYRAAGVDEFIIRDHAATPLSDALTSLGTLATDVIPHLR